MLTNPNAFFALARTPQLLGSMPQSEVNGCNAVLLACLGLPLPWAAYALATAFHETAGTMQPIHEYGSQAYLAGMYDPKGKRPALARRMGNTTPGDGVKYAGRGYVQLTWKANYEKAGRKLGLPLVDRPDLAMMADVAAKVMRLGMTEGWFTGKSFKDYLPPAGPASAAEFTAARRIINGTDKAAAIARYAVAFQQALIDGGWR